MKKLIPGISNWQLIVFIIIKKLMVGNNRRISRSELFSSDNIDFAVTLTELLGHKEKPKHPSETLQRTLQNLRDEGYIDFLGSGEYKLTDSGVETAENIGKVIRYDAINKVIKSESAG